MSKKISYVRDPHAPKPFDLVKGTLLMIAFLALCYILAGSAVF
jgi:hypothetical protein